MGNAVAQKPARTLRERFNEKWLPRPSTGCWIWTAARINTGYGRIGDGNGRNELAHRVSWRLHHGPIPDGLCVLHTCDVPACVNPDHLFLGTAADNVADMMRKGRAAVGPRREKAISPAEAIRARVRWMLLEGASYESILEAIGGRVGLTTISSIHSGIARKNLQPA